MAEVLHLTPADGLRQTRRKGRGGREELALWPPGSEPERGGMAWRISRARVEEPGPFSSFPGHERVLVVTAGPGLVLEHADDAPRARLRPLEPYRFSGDWATRAELLGAPVSDFHVIVRRDAASAQVEVLRLGRRSARETLGPGHAFAHVLAGCATARVTGEEEPFELEPGDSLWARDLRGGEELDLAGEEQGTVVLLVRLAPATS